MSAEKSVDAAATAEVEVDRIAAGGDGVGRDPEGRVVFVPRTAPGDRVRVRFTRVRPRWARGEPEALLAPGPTRRVPECAHYDDCGGCQLQHLEPVSQREARRQIVEDALQRIGGIGTAVAEPIAAGSEWGYRNRITLTFERTESGPVCGYVRREAANGLFALEDCPLAEAPIRAAWATLRDAIREDDRLLPEADRLRITLRASAAGRVALLIRGGNRKAPGNLERAAGLIPDLESCLWRPERGEWTLVRGADLFADRWGGIELELGPEAFVQVNRRVSDEMDRFLSRASGPPEGRRLVELYAGVGVRAMAWAAAGGRATACDRERDAIEAGRRAAAARGVAVQWLRSPVERVVGRLGEADVIVVNPPRAGLSALVARTLATTATTRLFYVSCDPSTLARDLRVLGERWEVAEVQPFDAFPNTAHVETIVRLERASA